MKIAILEKGKEVAAVFCRYISGRNENAMTIGNNTEEQMAMDRIPEWARKIHNSVNGMIIAKLGVSKRKLVVIQSIVSFVVAKTRLIR